MIYLIKSCLSLLALFPLPLNHVIGRMVGLLLFYSQNASRRVSETNISICFPDWSEQQRRELLKNSLIEMGKTMTEIAAVWGWNKERVLKYLTVSNEEIIQKAIDSKRGVIFLTPHLGCWEIAGLYLGQKLPVTALYQQPKLAGLDSLTRKARERSGATLVNTGRKGIAALLKALKSAQSVGILPDQTPKSENSGVFAPFFNRPALTMTLIANLARKSDAMIVIGYVKRKAQGKGYHLYLQQADGKLSDDDPVVAASALNKVVETLISREPEQYQWSYKRFKKVPPGLAKVYK